MALRAARVVLAAAAVAVAASAGSSAAPVGAAAAPRRALQWLVPYGNLSTVDDYVGAWRQLPARHRAGQSLYALSAYALKENNASLGYATTPAGEAAYGLQAETLGLPALRRLLGNDTASAAVLGMVYVTHSDAIARMLADPTAFVGQLAAKAEEQGLAGFDIDYEPQQVSALGLGASFMDFLALLSAALAPRGRVLTVDIGGCPSSDAFACAGLGSNASLVPALVQANCMNTFNARGVADVQAAQAADAGAGQLGARWAPGFEPGNIGQAAFAAMTAYLGSPAACGAQGAAGCPMSLATWAVHEWNVGPQPTWLFDAIDSFLDAPLPPPAGGAVRGGGGRAAGGGGGVGQRAARGAVSGRAWLG